MKAATAARVSTVPTAAHRTRGVAVGALTAHRP